MPPNTTQDTHNSEMNLKQIQVGDYSSLLGTWKKIVYADNLFDGIGQQWLTGRKDSTDINVLFGLSPAKTLISVKETAVFCRFYMILRQNMLE